MKVLFAEVKVEVPRKQKWKNHEESRELKE